MIQIDEKGYKCLSLQEYKGKYRIEQGRMSKDKTGDMRWYAEKIKSKHWVEASRTFEYSDKESNLSVSLGDKEKAIEALQSLLAELTGESPF
jgi:hypothetical protein